MNHLAQIQVEFLKTASKWQDLSSKEQRKYLKRHPKSKRRLTSKSEIMSKNRSRATIKLNKPNDKFEKALLDKIITVKSRDTSDGTIYKFKDDYEWEKALDILQKM
ncbi:MAG: hypothetical protein Q7R33_08085 [Nitrosarchaeum sp.]|nr:hypothetical protein [Nitrosarchaeum sp.]